MSLGRVSWRALGTSVDVLVADGARAIDLAAAAAVRRVLRDVDATYSRFRPDSELVALNAQPGRDIPVSPLLSDAIGAAIRAARLTDGAVDLTVGRAMRALGYDRDFAALDPTAALTIALAPVPGWQAVHLDAVRRTVRLTPGVELDLGSTGKAFAADLAAAAAHRATGAGVLVNLGGDLATAGVAPRGGWTVAIADDAATDPRDADETIGIMADAIATSSTTVRRWTAGGEARHHIVDPTTGRPAAGPWRTATVIAATCVDANTAATAAIVLGRRAAPWLEAIGVPARLVGHDGEVRYVGAWPVPKPRTAAA
jgi:thiamine biosynthesis lipoprotein